MTIWYDVSGIYNWVGHFTGIQRVVYNLGKELNGSEHATKFFVYHSGRFKEVSFAELESRLIELNKSKASKALGKQRPSLRAVQHHGMVALKAGIRSTPFEMPARKLYAGLRRTYRGVRSESVRTTAAYSSIFKKDDIVIVVDGNWQFAEYAQAMAIAKKHASFKFLHFVHDLAAVRNPALANPGADKIIGGYFKKIFKFADGIITISESTKRDVEWFLESLGMPRELPISTIILGDNIAEEPVQPHKPPTIADEPFILAVSTVEIRKNYRALYYVYKLAHEKNIDLPRLIIVGRKGWSAEETYLLLTEDPEIKRKITILSAASDNELEWLYQNCIFTVFPSFYEGWGLPIAETLAHGKTGVSSNASSMPEVGRDLVTYVSPYDPSAMLDAITSLSDDVSRRALEEKVRSQYKMRTWAESGQDLLAVIHDTAKTDQ